jgi:hypothetical protein
MKKTRQYIIFSASCWPRLAKLSFGRPLGAAVELLCENFAPTLVGEGGGNLRGGIVVKPMSLSCRGVMGPSGEHPSPSPKHVTLSCWSLPPWSCSFGKVGGTDPWLWWGGIPNGKTCFLPWQPRRVVLVDHSVRDVSGWKSGDRPGSVCDCWDVWSFIMWLIGLNRSLCLTLRPMFYINGVTLSFLMICMYEPCHFEVLKRMA